MIMRCGCLLLLSLLVVCESSAQAVQPPNILVIMGDDIGVNDIDSFQSVAPIANPNTPALNQLAADGVRFTRFYTDSTCSASRAAFLTGIHPARLGFQPVARGISPDVPTVADFFRAHGYSTHHVGKWHAGEYPRAAWPGAQGFDTSVGFLNQWMLQGPDKNGELVLDTPSYYNPWLMDKNGAFTQAQGFLTDVLAARSVELITQLAKDQKPWLLFHASLAPHEPLIPPPGTPEGASKSEIYHRVVHKLDDEVGALLQALHDTNQEKNTIVVFLGDNGGTAKHAPSNAPYYGGKATYFEGGVRAPLIIRVPDKKLDVKEFQQAVTIQDVYPTLAALAGFSVTDQLDGRNVLAPGWKPATDLYWLDYGRFSILSEGRWRLSRDWYLGGFTGDFLLDQQTDPTGNPANNTFAQQNDRAQTLQKKFEAWLRDVSLVSVKAKGKHGAATLTGNDFLRAPINPQYSFYVALQPNKTLNKQKSISIVQQEGVWSLQYQPEKHQAVLALFGQTAMLPLHLDGSCQLIGIETQVQDRYSSVNNHHNPSYAFLVVDGKAVGNAKFMFDNLSKVDLSTPTLLGVESPDVENSIRLSTPRIYNRTWASELSPFTLDTAALKKELCAQLK